MKRVGEMTIERPWQSWERNYSGGRIGVQEQQGRDENWMILHVESGGVKTTTSLRLNEAWDLALLLSPQLKAELDRRHKSARAAEAALYSLTWRECDTDLLRRIADEHSCGDGCEHAFGGFGLAGCSQTYRDGCRYAEADQMRALADGIDLGNATVKADVLRAIDSCGGSFTAAEEANGYADGYRRALAAAKREVSRLLARTPSKHEVERIEREER